MALIGNVGQFNEQEENFDSYCNRMQGFFDANSIDESKRVSCLTALIGPTAFQLLEDLVSPRDPLKCSYDEVITAMKNHYKPPVIEISERYKFYARKQGENEKVSEFAAALKALARTCNFGNYLESLLRDAFVMGIRDENTLKTLLTTETLTFQSAMKIAKAKETADKDIKVMHKRGSDFDSTNKISDKSKSNNGPDLPKKKCYGCGQLHWKKDCPFKESVCHACNKKGHIQKVCHSKNKNSSSPSTNHSSAANQETNEEYILYSTSPAPYQVSL